MELSIRIELNDREPGRFVEGYISRERRIELSIDGNEYNPAAIARLTEALKSLVDLDGVVAGLAAEIAAERTRLADAGRPEEAPAGTPAETPPEEPETPVEAPVGTPAETPPEEPETVSEPWTSANPFEEA